MSLGIGSFNSTIRFDNGHDVDVEMTATSLSAAWLMNDSWTARAVLGAILDGELMPDASATQQVKPGGLAAVGLEYIALVGGGYTPFIDFSLFLSGTATETENPLTGSKTSYFASDLRLGARAGWSVNGKIFPYVTGRVFGGPVNWELDGEDVTGSDIYHYQLAMGGAVQFDRVSIYFEWAGLGEQAVRAGLSTAW